MNKSNLLVNLGKLKGVDDDGYTCETAVLTGNVTVENMSESRLEKLEATFPQLNITVNNVIPDYTVKFVLDDEGAQVWNEQTVEQGSPAERPTDPTKESSISTDYTFAGWQGNFSDIQEDTVIKAQWKESVRKYTVRYYNLSFVIQEDIVEYGGSSTYKGEDLQQAGYIWTGWNETADSVDHDMDIQAVYEVPALPTEIKNMTEYDYIVSDDESDNSAYTYAELYAICAAGLEETYFAVGDKIKVVFQNGVLTDKYAELAIDGFRHYRLENGGEVNATHEDGDYSAFASIVFTMVGVLNSTRAMNSTNTNIGGWDVTAMRKWLNSTIIKTLKPVWRSIIKPVQISTTVGNSSTDIVTSVDNLFLLSQTDVGFSTVVPYKLEVDTGAKTQVLPKYTSSSSRVKKKYNGTGDAAWWWLRSPYSDNSTQFCGVSTGGGAGYNNATYGGSVAFSFCV
jgi:hypothetical protein